MSDRTDLLDNPLELVNTVVNFVVGGFILIVVISIALAFIFFGPATGPSHHSAVLSKPDASYARLP